MSNITSNKKVKVKEILDKYRLAGEIAIEAKELANKICKPGANAYEVCNSIEDLIRKRGALPAFPTNISFDNEAAHYSAEILDDRTVQKNAIVKIDLGAHIDGYIVDTAITLNFNPELKELTQSSKTALEKAIDAIKPGVKLSHIGKIVEDSIVSDGYQPVRNLSGHQIKRYTLHAGVSVPNCGPGYFEKDKTKFQAGRIYAIEPFASTGKGWIKDSNKVTIFRILNSPKKKHNDLMGIYNEYKEKVGVLPFSPRMLYDKNSGKAGKNEIMKNIRKLLQTKIIMGYAVLVEEDPKALISQHEHTIRVTSNGTEQFT